ncbi:hypothetical protein C8R44DRAFT_724482 [Mycena epipterygia]|nr:hypothetical protein C8R44DRAFT_724482 [Mycena epipterygia]
MLTPPVAAASTEDLDAEWLMVSSPGSPPTRTEPGLGGSEADPFLTRLPNPHPGGSGSTNAGVNNNAAGGGNNSGGGANSNSASSRGTGSTSATTSSGTNTSGYGVLLAHPSLSMPANAQAEGGNRNPFDVTPGATTYRNLPPGAAPPNNGNNGAPVPGRRILSPSQMAILVEEDVLPRRSEDEGSHLSGVEEGEVVVARRVAVSPTALAAPSTSAANEKRRSWIPRFSWLNRDSPSGSRSSRDIEEEGGLLLFDAGRHSPSGSISSPVSPLSPLDSPPRLVGVSGSGSGAAVASGSGSGGEMREFGARPLLPFLARSPSSRPASGVPAGSRPISGASGMSSDGTNGSGKSGGTVYTDARETLSTQNSSARIGNAPSFTALRPGDEAQASAGAPDPLDLPAPPPFAAFVSSASSQHSLHSVSQTSLAQHSLNQSTSASASLSNQHTTLGGSSAASNTTLATTPVTGHAPLKPERAYAHGPPGLGVDSFARDGPKHAGSVVSWDAAGLELGFSRPASHSQLGTFGSANVLPPVVPTSVFGAPGIRVVGAPVGVGVGTGLGGGGALALGDGRSGRVAVARGEHAFAPRELEQPGVGCWYWR